MLLRSLRIMHRHCRTPPRDVTHPCDVLPFFSPSLLGSHFDSLFSPHTLTGILSLPCFSLDKHHYQDTTRTLPVPADSEQNTNLNVNTEQMLHFHTIAICWREIFTPSQLISTTFGVTHSVMLVAAEGALSGLRCKDLNGKHTEQLMQVSLHQSHIK